MEVHVKRRDTGEILEIYDDVIGADDSSVTIQAGAGVINKMFPEGLVVVEKQIKEVPLPIIIQAETPEVFTKADIDRNDRFFASVYENAQTPETTRAREYNAEARRIAEEPVVVVEEPVVKRDR